MTSSIQHLKSELQDLFEQIQASQATAAPENKDKGIRLPGDEYSWSPKVGKLVLFTDKEKASKGKKRRRKSESFRSLQRNKKRAGLPFLGAGRCSVLFVTLTVNEIILLPRNSRRYHSIVGGRGGGMLNATCSIDVQLLFEFPAATCT